jgi:hypothetical protein
MEPALGFTVKPKSVMASAKASQPINLRAVYDLDSSDEKTLKVEVFTRNICWGGAGCSSEVMAMAAWGAIPYIDECVL